MVGVWAFLGSQPALPVSPPRPPTQVRSYAMEIVTSRFGSLQIHPQDTICFPAGLPGFEDCREWVLLAENEHRPVAWLQATGWADLALPVVDPRRFSDAYTLRLAATDLAPLGLDHGCEAQVLAVVAQHDGVLTLNLKAPVAINMQRRLGRQVVNRGDWPLCHSIASQNIPLKKIA